MTTDEIVNDQIRQPGKSLIRRRIPSVGRNGQLTRQAPRELTEVTEVAQRKMPPSTAYASRDSLSPESLTKDELKEEADILSLPHMQRSNSQTRPTALTYHLQKRVDVSRLQAYGLQPNPLNLAHELSRYSSSPVEARR